jgi:hypothetical protein
LITFEREAGHAPPIDRKSRFFVGRAWLSTRQLHLVASAVGRVVPSTINPYRVVDMNGCRRSFVARGIFLTLVLVATQHLFHRSGRIIGSGGTSANNKRTSSIKAGDISNRLDEAFFPGVSKDTAEMQQAEKGYKELYGGNHTITLKDLADLSFDADEIFDSSDETWDEAAASRKPIMDLLRAAGLQVDLDVLRRLPRWSEVTDLYGSEPVIYGTETCEPFRNKIPSSERFVGVAGQMNTGTNALGKYLLHNVKIPENEISNGILWTVPWYKHGWASLKQRYDYRPPENHTKVFAVVIIKDPLFWMKRYVSCGERSKNCPSHRPASVSQFCHPACVNLRTRCNGITAHTTAQRWWTRPTRPCRSRSDGARATFAPGHPWPIYGPCGTGSITKVVCRGSSFVTRTCSSIRRRSLIRFATA